MLNGTDNSAAAPNFIVIYSPTSSTGINNFGKSGNFTDNFTAANGFRSTDSA